MDRAHQPRRARAVADCGAQLGHEAGQRGFRNERVRPQCLVYFVPGDGARHRVDQQLEQRQELRSGVDDFAATRQFVARTVGRPAPRLDPGLPIGLRSRLAVNGSPALLLFFWAHWCPECMAESATLARLLDKYRARGLTIVAPTKRYGYVQAGRPAAPDKELRHIAGVRDTYFRFLQRVPVPMADSNHIAHGVDAIPTKVLIDRQGIIRLYQPGRITEADLDAAIVNILER
jgi:peroxiredoxin